MDRAVYFRAPHAGPDCSTPRSARLRQRRFDLGYEQRTIPPELAALAEAAAAILEAEPDPSLGRARALAHVVEHVPLALAPDACLLGGEDPFFFNLLLPALQRDPHGCLGQTPPDELTGRLRSAGVLYASCFEGHITPGLHQILGQGVVGILARIDDALGSLPAGCDEQRLWYEAARLSCASLLRYAERLRAEALRLAARADPEWAAELKESAETLARVPAQPAATFREALHSYWLAYILVTLEMGGCCPGGGLGLGRMDQFFLPYYRADLAAGRLTRQAALELLETFLLGFRHIDYFTGHQIYTPGSHGSLGGVTPQGDDASNELTELIMEASLRIAMPAPYLSLRLHRDAPERWWQAAAAYVAGGLGFPISNDEALIPAFLKHGRAPDDARDYICSCCYENTIPGREAFHPNGCYLNLPLVLELALNQGRSLLTGEELGAPTPEPGELSGFDALLAAFEAQLAFVAERLVALVNGADRSHMAHRRYPLMSCFIDDCLGRGLDVCAGGARYNLTGCIVAGLPNVVNSLAAIRQVVGEGGKHSLSELAAALRSDFADHEPLRRELLAAPKWGNDDPHCDDLAARVSRRLYQQFRRVRNPRGGRWQLALYSFVANRSLGAVVGASADGRRAGEFLTRNLDPTWGTDRHGPTSVLMSLSNLDYTCFPDGTSVNLNFDPAHVASQAGLEKFAGFLKAFVRLGVGTMQISMVGRETLLAAQANPERYPNLMVKVAGYSARFVDLDAAEQTELISRTVQRLG